MSLDKLNLTIFEPVDSSLMEDIGIVVEDKHRSRIYKYFVDLGNCQVMWHPHKYGPSQNERIGYTKIDFSPKHFPSFADLEACLRQYFHGGYKGSLNRFEVSRIDIKADIEDLPILLVLGRIFQKGLRDTSFSYFKGTIYMGVNPKFRIYNKTAEIKARKRKRQSLLPHEQEILDSEKELTRFEVMIKRPQFSLDQLFSKENFLLNHFKKLDFYDFEDAEQIANVGGLHLLIKNVRREYRKKLEIFKSSQMSSAIESEFLTGFRSWMSPNPNINKVPF